MFHTVLLQGLLILILPLHKLVTLYMHYLSIAALVAGSLLSRHYVLNEFPDFGKDAETSKQSVPPVNPPSQLPSISSISPQYALKFAREYR